MSKIENFSEFGVFNIRSFVSYPKKNNHCLMKRIVYFTVLIAILVMMFYSFSGNENLEVYQTSVLKYRTEKEDYLQSNSESPFVQDQKEVGEFLYFPVDRKYKLIAKVERIDKRQLSLIQNSDGSSLLYLKYAWLYFELNETPQKLLVLKSTFGNDLFLGFADGTSGDTSYGGGRYLDIEEIKGDRVALDFNLAYNPYCAYSEKFLCPFPPKENILSVKIEAGEKDYN